MNGDTEDRRRAEEDGATAGVGRQSGQQREHGHESREDQLRDRQDGAGGQSERERGTPHPDASPESVGGGRPGGTG